MTTLIPAPSTLGLHSPELAHWFHTDDTSATLPTLAAPSADLGVVVSLPDQVDWHAPTHGTRSWFVADATRPAGLARYRNASSAPAFTTGNVVVLFELWPDAELRLHALSSTLPRPDGSAASDVPTRPRIHALALEFQADSISTIDDLREPYPGSISDDDEKLAHLGLASAGTALTSGAMANPELRQVGTDSSVLVQNRTGSALACTLWSFDHLGRPVDPGAVAAWWNRLATTDWTNLWSASTAADNRTATVDDAMVVHLVDAHEGPLPAAHLVRLTPTGLTSLGSSGNVFRMATGTAASPSIALTTAPDPDDAPVPRLALLPFGSYGTIGAPDDQGTTVLSGWPVTTTPPLTRDFARLAFVDVESHLVGRDRTDPAQADADLRTAPAVNTAATPFATTTDAANAAVLGVLAGTTAVVMTPVADPEWGASMATALEPGAVSPISATVDGIAGEGRDDHGELVDQRIVVTFAEQLPAGAWVRVWSHGFDTTTGRQFRADGGGGRADANGTAYVVVPIADGAPGRMMTMDVLVVTATDRRLFGGVRFVRPELVAGGRVTLPDPPDDVSEATVWVCEQGAALDRTGGSLRSGDTLLVVPDEEDEGTFSLVALASVAASDFVGGTLLKDVGAGDRLVVTEPAFGSTEDGTVTAGINGSAFRTKQRTPLTSVDQFADWVGLGNPIPSMERREVAAVDEASDVAAIGTTPGRSVNHENPPSQDGHPGVVASKEVHGTGVSLGGPAAHRMVALMRERQEDTLDDFVTAATTVATAAAAPTGGGPQTWTVLLETIARGAAGDPALRAFVDVFPDFLPGDTWEDLRTAIENAVNGLPGVTGFSILGAAGASLTTAQATRLARAVDQLILTTRDGRQQGATAIMSAIGRAQDFVYLETPALDELTTADGAIDIIGTLVARLAANPSLSVIMCVPGCFLEGTPSKLEAMRRSGINGAIRALDAAGGDRVVAFTPTAGPGRHLYMSSTTVVVDDAVLVTGTTHLWRRGTTFDSSLAAALFDERVTDGRPTLVRSARRQLLADRLGCDVSLVGDDPADIVRAARLLNVRGGLGRVDTGRYTPAVRTADEADDAMWLPDGTQAGDWWILLAGLLGQTDEDDDDFVR